MMGPLYIAIAEEQPEVVSDLIKQGHDVNWEYIEYSPLSLAVETRNADIIKLLLNAGADPCGNSNFERSPFNAAIKSNSVYILNLFLNAIGGPNSSCLDSPPLHMAAKWGNSKIVKAVLESGADVNAVDGYKRTPLIYAVNIGNYTIIKMLIEYGVDVNKSDKYGSSPLHEAANLNALNKNAIDILMLLVRAGADVNKLCREYNQTPFNIFIRNESNVTCTIKNPVNKKFKLLIECTDVNLKNEKGKNIVSDILEFVSSYPDNPYETCIKKYAPKIIAHIAILEKLNLKIDASIHNAIFRKEEYSNHYIECLKELEKMKKTKLDKCWVNFLNLLVDDETRLLRYAGNQDLVEDFVKKVDKYPIYEPWMLVNMMDAVERRKVFDKATDILNDYLPIFRPIPLIIRDILDTLCDEDWKNLNKNKFLQLTFALG